MTEKIIRTAENFINSSFQVIPTCLNKKTENSSKYTVELALQYFISLLNFP